MIAILYPGELGSAIGRLLLGAGHQVITTLGARSDRTKRLCADSGIVSLPGLHEVAVSADIVISLVTPGSALEAARQYAYWAPPGKLFVDANSISPATSTRIAALLARKKIDFVDAAIHGLASRLKTDGTLYLNGDRSSEIAALFKDQLRVRCLEGEIGQASAFKMLLGGMSKGLVALFLEMALAAKNRGVLDEIVEEYGKYYPGLMTAIDRLVPTYPLHAERRTEEMKEIESMVRVSGPMPRMVRAARFNLAEVASLNLRDVAPAEAWTARSVVEKVHGRMTE